MRRFSKLTSILVTVITILTLMLSGCASKPASSATPSSPSSSTPADSDTTPQEKIKVGVALTNMGRGDRSFNDVTLECLDKAVSDFGIEYKDVTPKENAQFSSTLAYFADNDFDLIIAISFGYTEDIVNVAAQYPDSKFIGIDCAYDVVPENVQSVVFNEQESAYLSGVMAAMMSETGTVGFIGGMDAPLINKFEGGFLAGALATNPDIKTEVAYIGTDPTVFNNPAKAKEVALDQIQKGVDIIYQVANASGTGVFEACAEKNIYAIGQDQNQNWIQPGLILTSMMKNCDVAIYNIIEDYVTNKNFNGGSAWVGTLANGGVGPTDLDNLEGIETTLSAEDQQKIQDMKNAIPQAVKDAIKAATEGINSGEIVVPNWQVDGRPQ